MPKHNKTSPTMESSYNSTTTNTAGLPTPAQSTEIHAKSAFSALSLDGAFTLPPAAISSPPKSRNSSVVSSDKAESDSSYNPDTVATPSSASRGKQSAKRKSSTSRAGAQKTNYTVPPPPTRSRKIIQMKPRGHSNSDSTSFMAIAPDLTSYKEEKVVNSFSTINTTTTTTTTNGTKRKQAASATTAQGRKMARKTAHSLIERRRRSKMNEEFGVLKDMIPACTGQEMHKLAILQASIDYMRYLEKSLADLKSAHSSCHSLTTSPNFGPISRPTTTQPSTRSSSTTPPYDDSDMLDLPPIRQVLASYQATSSRQYKDNNNYTSKSQTSQSQAQAQAHTTQFPPISPPINPLSSAQGSPLHMAQYQPPAPATLTSSTSSHPSPLFEGQQQRINSSSSLHRLGSFSLTSPIVTPISKAVEEQHEEATAALLMLNTDRRSWDQRGSNGSVVDRRQSTSTMALASNSARSISVRDLLTS